jgi:NitT/TauT family transport system ATP-binding protein
MSVPVFTLKDVVKEFTSREGTRITAIEGVSLDALEGGITCIVGPTGSGKSTILRLLAGLELPESGTLSVGGHRPDELTGKLGYLTQRHTLFPWMRVKDNVGLPLELKRSGDRDERVRAICEKLGLAGAGDLYPYELSGGMQQRAALGRLLASEAPYWLLDEPFSNLDERTQHHLQRLALKVVKENGLTALFVTHLIDEAVYLADRIVVLSASPGRVVDSFEPRLPHPRDRLSPEYGRLIERVRQGIESVIGE